MKYNFKAIEKKWQKAWNKAGIFEINIDKKKKKYYVLEMFPYPSSEGLHMGHALNYSIGDVYVRFKRMQGFNVLYPMGFDSFGLPAENAAIKARVHPKEFTEIAIKNYTRQLKELGLSYDWGRIIETHKLEYYQWNQYFFLKFLEKGLVYRKKAPVNWCPECKTVLANEQVHNGKCWRHENTDVEIKSLEQWFIKTTKYADELLKMIDGLQWPERIKTMQKNWIDKSYGIEINFEINEKKWPIFTTRPDTIFGVTFMVISAQHPNIMNLITDKQKKDVEKFLKKIKSVSERELKEMEKEGVFTGSYAINPLTKEKVPVYAGNFVLADYGSGMVMAVPAHDQRDFEFAKKYNLLIKEVIKSKNSNIKERAYADEGIMINSEQFNGFNSKEAIKKISDYIEKNKLGKRAIHYKLKDWLISRQRYWGTPIPVVYCNKCGIVPVPEEDLPVILPEKIKFGKGNPLATNKKFIDVDCPRCKSNAKRETDTMDTFFDSSWYFLRFCDNKNKKEPFDAEKVSYWMPVDQYIGGAEHACMHLIYARFFTKALRDLGFFKRKKIDEPFTKLFNQGMLHGEGGEKMSKSKGNVINPDEIAGKYGMDTARFFLLSLSAQDKSRDWDEKGIEGGSKFLSRIIKYYGEIKKGKSNSRIESKMNKTIKELNWDIENFKYNLGIIKIRSLFESMEHEKEISKKDAEVFLKLLHPFCPHITEELWYKLGNKNFISLEKWPVADESKIDENLEKQEQAVEKLINDVNQIIKLVREKQDKSVNKAFVYVLPNELDNYKENLDIIEKKTSLDVHIFSVADKNKYDPENKSNKVKPGRPGVYLE